MESVYMNLLTRKLKILAKTAEKTCVGKIPAQVSFLGGLDYECKCGKLQ